MVSAKPESPEPHTIPIFGLNSVFHMFNIVRKMPKTFKNVSNAVKIQKILIEQFLGFQKFKCFFINIRHFPTSE